MKCLALILGLGLAALAGGAVTLYAGWYDISATDQHLAHTYWLLDTGMKRSVKQRADRIAVPGELGAPEQLSRGLSHFRKHCVQCHGAPGVAPEPFAMGMTPAPASLAYTATEWEPAALFWVIREGIKMTGMPAWKYRMSDADIWATVALLKRLPLLSPADYQALGARQHEHEKPPFAQEPSAERGKKAINQYLCVTCHRIPGIVGPNAPVGPPLAGIGARTMIAGRLPNSFDSMVRWLLDPQQIDRNTAMPDLGLSERDARDIAAYLATLK
jgi:mono/diheme cytochrome c family protein